MRKIVVTFLLGAVMSIWALNVVVPLGSPNDGGVIVMTGDPHTPEEWD